MAETTKQEQERAIGEPERRLLPVFARLAGWLIVPLYAISDLAYYLFTYGVVPWNNTSLLDTVQGMMLDLGFAAFALVGALLIPGGLLRRSVGSWLASG